jgi:SAM-dependent methyltransferase
MSDVRYDAIGTEYALTRREDPRVAGLIQAALGNARTVVNVGAGAGSYEPRDRHVLAIEPSEVMIAQRDSRLPPAVIAGAYPLPLSDLSVDAAMAVLTIHHWDKDQERGVREMRRVARGPVVILTFDAEVSARMWLMADYLSEVADLDRHIFPTLQTLARCSAERSPRRRCRFTATHPTGHSGRSGLIPSAYSNHTHVTRRPASHGCRRLSSPALWTRSPAISKTARGMSVTAISANSTSTTRGCVWL